MNVGTYQEELDGIINTMAGDPDVTDDEYIAALIELSDSCKEAASHLIARNRENPGG